MNGRLRAGLVQLCVSDDPGRNLPVTRDLVRQAALGGAGWVLTPEVTNLVGASRELQQHLLRTEDEDPTLAALRADARDLGIWLLIGSLALKRGGAADGDDRFVNRSFLIGPDGGIRARYDKLHMFDVTVSDSESYRESASFRPGDRAVLGLYLPHLAKAFELSRPIDRWRGLAAGLAATLDRLSIGICLIRPDRAVIAQNAEFRRQVDELGVMAVTRDGRLEVRHPEGRAWLERLTGDPARHGQFGARPRKEALGALRRDDQVSVSVEIAPLGTLEAFGGGRLDGYVVYCLDTSRPVEIDLEGVRRAMGLTAAEADLLGLLAEGLTNREIAGHRDRSVETINTQVKSLLAKADCANRTQLIRRATTIGCRFLA